MKYLRCALACFLLSSCSTIAFHGRAEHPGVLVSVVSGTAILKVEVSAYIGRVELDAKVGGKDIALDNGVEGAGRWELVFAEEKPLAAGDEYRLILKGGERVSLRFEGSGAMRSIIEIRKDRKTTRYALDQDDIIGRSIIIADD